MNNTGGLPTHTVISRFNGSMMGRGVKSGRPACLYILTSRDIEAETLVRLARKDYDWTGTLRGKRQRNKSSAKTGITRKGTP
jgi:hypothetical protein